MWYSPEEYMAIRQSAITTVMKMAKNEAVDLDPNDSSRGLEGRTPQQDALRQERRQIIAWSVLTEQEVHQLLDKLQPDMIVLNPELIASVRISCTLFGCLVWQCVTLCICTRLLLCFLLVTFVF